MNYTIKRQLTQILEICIQKQLFYDLSPHVFKVSIRNESGSFRKDSYYHGNLYNQKSIVDKQTLLLSDLLKEVKNH